MRPLIDIALMATLSGCASQPTPFAQVPTPAAAQPSKPLVTLAQAKQALIGQRNRLWKDPDSIRDATIGDPLFCEHDLLAAGGRFVKVAASCVCVEANARNSYGGYTGIKRTIAVFPEAGGFDTKDGGILGFQEYCQRLKPFPELNGRH